jgi:formate dehydrogenase
VETIVDGGGRLSWEELIASPHGLIYAEKSYDHLDEVIATADGAVHLAPDDFMRALRQALCRPVANASGSWPMLLSNQRLTASMNSWLNDTPTSLRRNTTNTLRVHPDDAERLGIRTGDRVRVTSPVGSLECSAEVSNDPQIGVAILAHGWGSRVFDPHGGAAAERHGINRNALVSDTNVDSLSGTPAFGTAAVRITRLEPEDGTDVPWNRAD